MINFRFATARLKNHYCKQSPECLVEQGFPGFMRDWVKRKWRSLFNRLCGRLQLRTEKLQGKEKLFTENKLDDSIACLIRGRKNVIFFPIRLISVLILRDQSTCQGVFAVNIPGFVFEFGRNLSSKPFITNSTVDLFFQKDLVSQFVYNVTEFVFIVNSGIFSDLLEIASRCTA